MKTKVSAIIVILGVLFFAGEESLGCGGCSNSPPVAVLTAIPDSGIPDVNVTLDGSESTDDGGITKYEWDFEYSGTFVCDYEETEANYPDGEFDGITTHTYTSSGTYIAMLRVTDNASCGTYLTDTDSCVVTVRGVKNVDTNEWYSTIQAAINDANSGNHILVYPGKYVENVDFNGVSCTLKGTDPNDWDVVANTIIDANGSGDVVTFDSGEGSNSVLKGFTITNGQRGIYCNGASPTINNCIIEDNNNPTGNGGGIYDCNASPTISNCFITSNYANYGTGMYNLNSSPTVRNSVFSWNSADANGGGIYNNNSVPVITNCTFINNDAGDFGGGMYSSGASSEPNLTNCIFWGNDSNDAGDEIYNASSAEPIFSYCDVNGCKDVNGVWDPDFGTNGGGNINQYPLFFEGVEGRVAHWKLDDGSGATAHDSEGNNDGTIYGATWTSGQSGSALNFDGSSDYVEVEDNNSLSGITDTFTIILWANPSTTHQIDTESTSGIQGIWNQKYAIGPAQGGICWGSGHAGVGVSVGTNGISVYEHSNGYMPPVLVWTGTVSGFTHIAVVYENKQPKLYVNGAFKKTGLTGSMLLHPFPKYIGGMEYGWFNGKVDDVMIFDEALNASEIEQLYQYGFTKYYHLITADSPCFNAGDPNGDYSGQKDIDGEQRVMWERVDIGADERADCNNAAPDAVLTTSPFETYASDTVTLDGSESTDDEGITKFEWDFDYSGTFSCDYEETEANHPDGEFDGITTHTYTSLGTYTVMLRLTDNAICGTYLTDTATCMVYITDNLIRSPGFEEPNTLSLYWMHGNYPPEANATEEIDPNGYTGNCAKMQHDYSSVDQAIYQSLSAGIIEAGTYEFYVKYKAGLEEWATMNLCDSDWKEPNEVDPNIPDTHPKSWGRGLTGYGMEMWNTIKRIVVIPEEDDYGEAITGHDFIVQVRGNYTSPGVPIYYDNVVLRKIDPVPQKYEQIEERDDWTMHCRSLTGPPQVEEYEPNMATICGANSDPNITGDHALSLHSVKTKGLIYGIVLPIKPSTKYRISTKLRYENRECYNYLVLDPNYNIGNMADTSSTKGIWCGIYRICIMEPNNAVENWHQSVYLDMPLLPPMFDEDAPDFNVNWYYEERYYQSSTNAVEMRVSIYLNGFIGKLYIDNLTIEEVDTHIDDKYLRIPIDYEFEGMKIAAVDSNIPSIETNAAKFVFDYDSIELRKKDGNDANTIGTITFNDNFLATLAVEEDVNGLVILNNDNVTISVGADSTMLIRLENDSNIAVKGAEAPKFYNFDAGIVFVTDYEKGLLFSPIYPELNRLKIPYAYDTNIVDYIYHDDEFSKCGLVKNWALDPNFSNSNWKVTYNCKGGDGFIASVFPPKDFNNVKYAKERAGGWGVFNINSEPDADYRYRLQQYYKKERSSIMLLGPNNYNVSDNNTIPEVYYVDEVDHNIPVSPNEPNAQAVDFVYWNISGPYNHIGEPNALNRLIEQAHKQNVKITFYTCPGVYYASEPNVLLENIKDIVGTYNIDGVYFDGYLGQPLKSLELVRKTRNYLQDKFYYQHSSVAAELLPITDRFKEPFYDAYSDQVWIGENRKKDWSGDPDTWVMSCAPDPNAWGLLYCSRNLSNTPSMLMPEFRPVDYSDPDNATSLTLTPSEQIELELKYSGVFAIAGVCGNLYYNALIHDANLNKDIYYDPRPLWWNPYDAKCLEYTNNDGVADVGETIYTARQDCAPDTDDAILTSNGNVYYCNTAYSVAQWIIDGNEPFYRLHYTFDANLASDDSDNRMNPWGLIGMGYSEPNHETKDGCKTFYFDGAKRFWGEHDETLCFTDDSNNTKSFSSFVVIKRDSNSAGEQVVFALNSDNHFHYGINNSKLYVAVKNSNNNTVTFSGNTGIDSNWHTLGIVYDSTSSKLKLYLDGEKDHNDIDISLYKFDEFGIYSIGGFNSSNPTLHFKGWIDDLFVTDRALTDQQVMQYHQTLHKTLTITDVNDPDEVYCIINKDGKKYTAERQ